MNTYFNPKLRYPNLKPINNSQIRGMLDDRGLLLPFLVGAAVAFPIGYIASNTNKNNTQYNMPANYQQPYMPYNQIQPYPLYNNLGYPIYHY